MNKPGQTYTNRVLYNIRKLALKDGHRFDLTDADVLSIITRPCFYCARDPYTIRVPSLVCNGKFPVSGIDRVDSDKGYMLTNVVPCCIRCNRMKRNDTLTDFLDQCKRIVLNHS